MVVTGYTLTTVPVGNAPLGTETASVEAPDVAVTESTVPEATLPETGVPYEVAASPEGGGALVVVGDVVVPPPGVEVDVVVAVAETSRLTVSVAVANCVGSVGVNVTERLVVPTPGMSPAGGE